MDSLVRIAATREEAHRAAREAYAMAGPLIDDGKRVRFHVEPHEPDRTLQQNRFYWGPCLRDISQQAMLNGSKWAPEAWHELFRRLFLGYEIKRSKVAGRKRPIVIRRLRSTKDLKVLAFSQYLNELQAFAATEYGVRFSTLRWEEYGA